MHYIFNNEAENKILKILEISVIGRWMADISVSAPKKPYRSISVDNPVFSALKQKALLKLTQK